MVAFEYLWKKKAMFAAGNKNAKMWRKSALSCQRMPTGALKMQDWNSFV